MYDTVNLTLTSDQSNCSFLETVPCHLTDSYEVKGIDLGNISINGRLRGLTLKVKEDKVSIIKGSICKFHLGNNIETLHRRDFKRAIENLSDELHLPFHKANVHRLDIAYNLVMDYNPTLYLSYFGNLRGYNRLEAENGLYYKKGKIQKAFYDKIREQKSKRQPIPIHLDNLHLLRYELRFLNSLPKLFNKTQLLASDLYNETFYMSLLDQWKEGYTNIQKVNTIIQTMSPTGSTKVFTNYLASIGLMDGGLINAYNMVREWQKTGAITKKQASDLRRNLKKLNNSPKQTQKQNLILELDRKIKDCNSYYL